MTAFYKCSPWFVPVGIILLFSDLHVAFIELVFDHRGPTPSYVYQIAAFLKNVGWILLLMAFISFVIKKIRNRNRTEPLPPPTEADTQSSILMWNITSILLVVPLTFAMFLVSIMASSGTESLGMQILHVIQILYIVGFIVFVFVGNVLSRKHNSVAWARTPILFGVPGFFFFMFVIAIVSAILTSLF